MTVAVADAEDNEMPILELRSPTPDSRPLLTIIASYVPPVGAVIELDVEQVELRGFTEAEAALLRSRRTWAWTVVAIRCPMPVAGDRRAKRVVLHLVPVVFGPEM